MALGYKTGGRQKGTPNRVSGQLRDMVLTALDDSGGIEYLKLQASANPVAFLSLLGKILPTQISGDPDNPAQIIFQWANTTNQKP